MVTTMTETQMMMTAVDSVAGGGPEMFEITPVSVSLWNVTSSCDLPDENNRVHRTSTISHVDEWIPGAHGIQETKTHLPHASSIIAASISSDHHRSHTTLSHALRRGIT